VVLKQNQTNKNLKKNPSLCENNHLTEKIDFKKNKNDFRSGLHNPGGGIFPHSL